MEDTPERCAACLRGFLEKYEEKLEEIARLEAELRDVTEQRDALREELGIPA